MYPLYLQVRGGITHPHACAAKQCHGHGKELVVYETCEDAEGCHQRNAVATAKAHAEYLVQRLSQELLLVAQQVHGKGKHQQPVAEVTCAPTQQCRHKNSPSVSAVGCRRFEITPGSDLHKGSLDKGSLTIVTAVCKPTTRASAHQT
jgi:hypothetical protein